MKAGRSFERVAFEAAECVRKLCNRGERRRLSAAEPQFQTEPRTPKSISDPFPRENIHGKNSNYQPIHRIGPIRFEIRLQKQLDSRWADCIDGSTCFIKGVTRVCSGVETRHQLWCHPGFKGVDLNLLFVAPAK